MKLIKLVLALSLVFFPVRSMAQPYSPIVEVTEVDEDPSIYPAVVIFPNTSVTENADGDAVIDWTGPLDLRYLLLDQSTPQTVITGAPIFDVGIDFSDDAYIGLGAATGRMEFDDQTTDEINFLSCDVGIGTTVPAERLHIVDGTGNDIVIGSPYANFGAVGFGSSFTSNNYSLLGNGSSTYLNASTGGVIKFRVNNADMILMDTTGRVGIGTVSPAVGLHGVVTNGKFLWEDSEADNTQKTGRWGIEHYDVDEEPFYSLVTTTGNGFNQLTLGGGTGQGNAATEIRFFTTATSATTTGTEKVTIEGDGTMNVLDGPVASAGTLGGFVIKPRDGSGTDQVWYNPTGDGVALWAGAQVFTINNSGNVQADGTIECTTIFGDPLADQMSYMLAGEFLEVLTDPRGIWMGLTPSDAGTEEDMSPKNHDMTYWDTSNWTTSDQLHKGLVWSLDFDGTNDMLWTADHADFTFGDSSNDSPCSFGGWVEIVDGAGFQAIIGKWIDEWFLGINVTENFILYLRDDNVAKVPNCVSQSVTTEGWHFLVATYDGTGGASAMSGVTLYEDGVALNDTDNDDADYVAMEDTVHIIEIGASETGVSNVWKGDVGLVFVDGEELSADDVWKLYIQTRGYYNE